MAEIGLIQDKDLIQRIVAKYSSKTNPEEIYYRKALEVIRLASRVRKEGKPLDSLSSFSRMSRASHNSFYARTGHQTVQNLSKL